MKYLLVTASLLVATASPALANKQANRQAHVEDHYKTVIQQVQTKRIKDLEADGYYVIKLIKTNKNGIPDLIAIHPEKGVLFSEVKRANGKLSPLQKYRIEELKKLGFNVEVHYGKTD